VLRVAVALEDWWFDRGLWSEGRGWLEWSLDRTDEHVAPETRAAGWLALAYLCWPDEDHYVEHIMGWVNRAWELYGGVNDRAGMALCQIFRAWTHHGRNDQRAARAAAAEAVELAQAADDWTRGSALRAQASIMPYDLVQARQMADEAAACLERVGDLRSLAGLWEEIAIVALDFGAIDDAREFIERALGLFEQLERPAGSATTVAYYGLVALESGDHVSASLHLREALEDYRARGISAWLSEILLALAVIASRDGQATQAGRLVGAARAVRSKRATLYLLEARLEETARATAATRCSADDWSQAVAAGTDMGPSEAIELGLETAGASSKRAPSALSPS
jgi:tetratricopeptide (TPR) repeat protein